ncbi:MAG: hypothetical protein AVDCRST_MAG19-2581, partial [uncultured Thermomicrobiales bacterium]
GVGRLPSVGPAAGHRGDLHGPTDRQRSPRDLRAIPRPGAVPALGAGTAPASEPPTGRAGARSGLRYRGRRAAGRAAARGERHDGRARRQLRHARGGPVPPGAARPAHCLAPGQRLGPSLPGRRLRPGALPGGARVLPRPLGGGARDVPRPGAGRSRRPERLPRAGAPADLRGAQPGDGAPSRLPRVAAPFSLGDAEDLRALL